MSQFGLHINPILMGWVNDERVNNQLKLHRHRRVGFNFVTCRLIRSLHFELELMIYSNKKLVTIKSNNFDHKYRCLKTSLSLAFPSNLLWKTIFFSRKYSLYPTKVAIKSLYIYPINYELYWIHYYCISLMFLILILMVLYNVTLNRQEHMQRH